MPTLRERYIQAKQGAAQPTAGGNLKERYLAAKNARATSPVMAGLPVNPSPPPAQSGMPERVQAFNLAGQVRPGGQPAITAPGLGGQVRRGLGLLADIGKPVGEYFMEQGAKTPWRIAPDRDLTAQPLTADEINNARVWAKANGATKLLAELDRVANRFVGGTVDLATQAGSRLVNPEKYQGEGPEASGPGFALSSLGGLLQGVQDLPAQAGYLSQEALGTEFNPITQLMRPVSGVLNVPALLQGQSLSDIESGAVNRLYEAPESPLIAAGVAGGIGRGLGKLRPRTGIEAQDLSRSEFIDRTLAEDRAPARQSAYAYEQGPTPFEQAEQQAGSAELAADRGPTRGPINQRMADMEAEANQRAINRQLSETRKAKQPPGPTVPETPDPQLEAIRSASRVQLMNEAVNLGVPIADVVKAPVVELQYLVSGGRLGVARESSPIPEVPSVKPEVLKSIEPPSPATKLPVDEAVIPDVSREAKTVPSAEKPPSVQEIRTTGPETAPLKAPAASLKAKEPWEMTRAEYIDGETAVYIRDMNLYAPETVAKLEQQKKQSFDDFAKTNAVDEMGGEMRHRKAVEQAMSSGRPVPASVLADYPDLAAKPASLPKAEGAKETITPEPDLRGGGLGFAGILGRTKGQQLTASIAARRASVERAPTIELDRKPADARPIFQHPAHKYGAIPDEFGEITPNFGLAAAEAQQKLMLTERDIRVDQSKGARALGEVTSKLNRWEWKRYNDKIQEYIERPIADLDAATLPEKAKQVVRGIKERADAERTEIVEMKRGEIRESMAKLAEQQYRAENGLKGKRLDDAQRSEIQTRADDMVKAEVPETWGIKDYFPHLHLGEFTILRDGRYIGSAKSWGDALPKIVDDFTVSPTDAPNYAIKLREFHNPDVVRVSRARQYKIINDLAKDFEAGSTERIADILRGKIGSREGRRKWASFMQERKGAVGYEKDVRFVLNYHNRMYNRWKHLYRLQNEIQPLVKQIRSEGRDMVAREMEYGLAELWGRPPAYRGEYAVKRWASRIRGATTGLMLKTSPRYNLMNSLQLAQTGMVVPYKSLAWAQRAVRTAEGKALLDRFGVYDMVQGTGGELTKTYTSAKTRSSAPVRTLRLSPETSNQAEIWLATYKHGKNLGMADQAAADYAFLRGNVYSQFLPLRTNQPVWLRNDLVRTTVGMYRSFTTGALELGADLSKKTFGKNVPLDERTVNAARLAHYVTAQLALGGARLVTGPMGKFGLGYLTYSMYQKVKKEYGEDVADLIQFGLPSLLNSDWSASVQMIDLPYADNPAEAIGQVVLGPVGSSVQSIAQRSTSATGPETNGWEQFARAFMQQFGGTRAVLGLEKVLTGDYDFKSPDGKLQFEGDFKDALVQMYGSRPVKAAVQSMRVDALMELVGHRNDAINAAVHGDASKIAEFNAKWPDMAISRKDVADRKKSRGKALDKSTYERMSADESIRKHMKRMEAGNAE